MSDHEAVKNWRNIMARVRGSAIQNHRPPEDVALVAVSKNFPAETIEPVIQAGQLVFGENRVQEAKAKWTSLRPKYPHVELHLIGPLQSNKVADAVAAFDVIQTVDRLKLALALAPEIKRQGKNPKLMVQVNTGEEPQKAGVHPSATGEFLKACSEIGLTISGLMCIPPIDQEPALHFMLLAKLAQRHNLKYLSMGMSADFETAIGFGATHVRVGSGIFGTRS